MAEDHQLRRPAAEQERACGEVAGLEAPVALEAERYERRCGAAKHAPEQLEGKRLDVVGIEIEPEFDERR